MKPKLERFDCLDCGSHIHRKDICAFTEHPFCDGCHLRHFGRLNNEKLTPDNIQEVFPFYHEDFA